jgi:hypothetical protein
MLVLDKPKSVRHACPSCVSKTFSGYEKTININSQKKKKLSNPDK